MRARSKALAVTGAIVAVAAIGVLNLPKPATAPTQPAPTTTAVGNLPVGTQTAPPDTPTATATATPKPTRTTVKGQSSAPPDSPDQQYIELTHTAVAAAITAAQTAATLDYRTGPTQAVLPLQGLCTDQVLKTWTDYFAKQDWSALAAEKYRTQSTLQKVTTNVTGPGQTLKTATVVLTVTTYLNDTQTSTATQTWHVTFTSISDGLRISDLHQ